MNRVAVDPDKQNLVATVAGSSDRMLCFNGHLATVPFDASDWTHSPLGERVDDRVYRRSATDGGDAKALRHEGIPTVELGFGIKTAHGTDEYTTVEALTRNATAYAMPPYEFDRVGQRAVAG